MRLTTKIIIGIIMSFFILSLLLIIGYSFTDRKNYRRSFPESAIKIPQENKTCINLEKYKVIILEVELSDTERSYYCYFPNEENGLFISPATTGDEENKLFFPEALNDFIYTQINNDTLTVKIKIDEVRENFGIINGALEKREISRFMYGYSISGFNLHLHTLNVNVINNTDIETQIRNMKTDSIKIYSTGEITIDSCFANVIEPSSKRKLTVTNSIAKSIYLDLDIVNDWNIDNDSDIDAYFFSGSKKSNNISLRSDYRGKIIWQPKNTDAEFNIKIKGNAAEINFETQSISD